MTTLTPIVISIDVEPDERLVDPSARPRWAGFEAMLAQMERVRTQLARATNAPVRFCWLVRVDPQIERAYGRPDWGLENYKREFADLRARGDVIGAHAHSWRWDDAEGTWIADHGNVEWVRHCVRLALETFRRTTGRPARAFSHGDEFLSNDVVALAEELGVRYDITIAPGNQPVPARIAGERATGSLPDLRGVPQVPYRPSPDDFRTPDLQGRRRLWLMPITTGQAVNPYAGSGAIENQILVLGAPESVNRLIFEAYRESFPVCPDVAVARSDVFLDSINAEQFGRFIDYLAEHPDREQFRVTTPDQGCRAYRRVAGRGAASLALAQSVTLAAHPGGPHRTRAVDGATIHALEQEVQLLRQRLDAIEQSRWWRLRRRLLHLRALIRMKLSRGHRKGLLYRLLRALFGTRRRNFRWVAKSFFKQGYLLLEEEAVVILSRTAIASAESSAGPSAAAAGDYAHWLAVQSPRPADLAVYREMVPLLEHRPRISVLLPVFNPPLGWFKEAVQSVFDQVYPDWELCIADDASTDPEVLAAIADFAQRDGRVRVVRRPTNGHISAASNSALELATGDYCAMLDQDDLLSPDALFHNAMALLGRADLDLLYSDEDKIDDAGLRCEPHFKPQWSPDTLLSGNYVCHLLVARTALVREIGGFRVGLEGAQDLDLVLRLSERTRRIHHIPRVLYHWRKHPQSTAQSAAAKPYAYRAGQRAIEEALERRREPGTVSFAAAPGSYLVRYALRPDARTSIVIPTRDQAALLEACLVSLFERTRCQEFQVLVVDNGSREPRTFELLKRYARRHPERFSVLRDDGAFNFSRLVNAGAAAATDPFLLLLNNDVEATEPDWLTAMLEQAQRPSVGCVGARLLYPNGSVQHAGVAIGRGRTPEHAFRNAPADAAGYANRLQSVTNYSAVTGACLLVRRAVFEEAGGFDEGFAVDYNDVDFCLRVREAGYHNVLVPQATLIHHEMVSRGHPERTAESARRHAAERTKFLARWAKYVAADPCLSPHLTLGAGDLRTVA